MDCLFPLCTTRAKLFVRDQPVKKEGALNITAKRSMLILDIGTSVTTANENGDWPIPDT
jgi:hypothetical protein